MAALLANGIKTFFGELLLKPIGWKPCQPGYEPGSTDELEGDCYPILEAIPELQEPIAKGELIQINKGAAPQDKIYERRWVIARTAGLANSSNCAPNTFGFNGNCLSECPAGTIAQALPDSDPKRVATNPRPWRYSCIAASAQSWHGFTWRRDADDFFSRDPTERDLIWQLGSLNWLGAAGNINDFAQTEGLGSNWSFHDPASRETATEGFTPVPYNLYPHNAVANNPMGLPPNIIVPGATGIYAERSELELGAPKLAGSCPAPNVMSDGNCWRPTPRGMELIDNRWVTDLKCPANYTFEINDGQQCAMKAKLRGKYPSLLQLLLGLVGILLIILVIVKVIQALRRK